mgnify:CR=1 FL=1
MIYEMNRSHIFSIAVMQLYFVTQLFKSKFAEKYIHESNTKITFVENHLIMKKNVIVSR